MPRIPIDDPDDPRLAMYRHLKATNETRGADEFVVEGEKLFDRLRRSRFPLASVLATDRFEPQLAGRVPADVPLYVVPHEWLSDLVGFRFHRGVLACGRRRPPPDLGAIAHAAGPRLTIVACPELYNPENLGTIVRTADVFGVDAVLVGPTCPDPFSRRVLRVSMGTVLDLPVLVAGAMERDVERLRVEFGAEVVATVVDPAAEPLDRFRRPDRLVLLLGSEGDGLRPAWVGRSDRRLTIPMRPGAESLNVAVATGVILYHLGDRGPAAGEKSPEPGP